WPAVQGVLGMHLQAGDPDHESGPEEGVLAVMVAQHVADVLAQVALDALSEFDDAVDVLLLHAPGLGVEGVLLARREFRDSLVDIVVLAHDVDQVTDYRDYSHDYTSIHVAVTTD